jgi:hypothetical protein
VRGEALLKVPSIPGAQGLLALHLQSCPLAPNESTCRSIRAFQPAIQKLDSFLILANALAAKIRKGSLDLGIQFSYQHWNELGKANTTGNIQVQGQRSSSSLSIL